MEHLCVCFEQNLQMEPKNIFLFTVIKFVIWYSLIKWLEFGNMKWKYPVTGVSFILLLCFPLFWSNYLLCTENSNMIEKDVMWNIFTAEKNRKKFTLKSRAYNFGEYYSWKGTGTDQSQQTVNGILPKSSSMAITADRIQLILERAHFQYMAKQFPN